MKYDRKYLLWLAGCGARGAAAPAPEEAVNWEAMMTEAAALRLRPFAAGAIKRCKEEICPTELKRQLTGEIIGQAVKYHLGIKKMADLQDGLKRMGIASAVIKGYALSAAYPVPELRMGQDVDLYVAPRQEKRAVSWLTANGWRLVQKRGWCSNHNELKKEDFGYLELHTKFHPRFAGIYYRNSRLKKGIWGPSEPFERMDTEEGSIDVLDVNDHFIFICVHMIRHLLEGEVTVRMILDTAAFLNTYQDNIDWSRTWDIMEALKCKKLFSAILASAETYFGYSFKDIRKMDIPLKEQEQLMELFCNVRESSPYDKMRLRYEYNNMEGTGRRERFKYRLFALSCYFDVFEKRIKKYGMLGYLRQGFKTIAELTQMGAGEKTPDIALQDNKTRRSDEVLLLLKNMEIL